MLIGYAQFRPIFGRKELNLRRALGLLEKGAELEADLMVLPELFNTGYVFRSGTELERYAEAIPGGRTSRALISFSEENGMCICAGICEGTRGGFYNSALLTIPGGHHGVYRKTHLFGEERRWFRPGNTGFRVFKAKGSAIGIMICFDWFFPESVRVLALQGAQLICHPANLVLPYCQRAMLGAAVQNRVFIITANRIGAERGQRFTGRSQIVAPDMSVLASSVLREGVKVIDVDPTDADEKGVTEYNDAFGDRRPGFYSTICLTTGTPRHPFCALNSSPSSRGGTSP
jgi:beta-ureidopropionase